MNHLDNLLGSVLSSTFTGGFWAGRARDKCPTPYATYIYFGPANVYLGGRGSMQNKTVQIDIWTNDVATANTLADTVEAIMDVQNMDASPSSFTATQTNRQLAPPDLEVKLQRIVLEFSVWFRP